MDRKTLQSYIASKKGRWVAIITGLVMGGLTQLLTSKGLEMPGEIATALSGLVAVTFSWLIDTVAARILNTSMAQIQAALPGVLETGGAAPYGKTVQAVQSLAAANDGPMPYPAHILEVKPLTYYEISEIRMRMSEVLNNPEILRRVREEMTRLNGLAKS